MNSFIQRLVGNTRSLLADLLGQVLAFLMFIVAGIAWLYFSTVYAVIPVFIVGILVGGYFYGMAEGKKK